MSATICNRCECNCGCIYHPIAAIPKDSETAVPGKLPTGQETNDIRHYCAEHYIKPEE